jgi:hypothetical protein
MLFNDNHKDLINRALDGEIDAAEHAVLTDILDSSPADAALWERMRAVDHTLRQAPMVKPPIDFAAQVMAQVHAMGTPQPKPTSGGALLAWRLMTAASIAIVLLLFSTRALVELIGPMPSLEEIGVALGDLAGGLITMLEWLVDFVARYPELPAILFAALSLGSAIVWLAAYYAPKEPGSESAWSAEMQAEAGSAG